MVDGEKTDGNGGEIGRVGWGKRRPGGRGGRERHSRVLAHETAEQLRRRNRAGRIGRVRFRWRIGFRPVGEVLEDAGGDGVEARAGGVAHADVAAQGALELDVLGGVADAEEQVVGGGVGPALEARGPERGGAFLDGGVEVVLPAVLVEQRGVPVVDGGRAAVAFGVEVEEPDVRVVVVRLDVAFFAEAVAGEVGVVVDVFDPPLFVVLDHGLDALVEVLGELVELLPQRLVELARVFAFRIPVAETGVIALIRILVEELSVAGDEQFEAWSSRVDPSD